MADGIASRFNKYPVGHPSAGTPIYPAGDERLLDSILATPGGPLLSRAGKRPGGGLEVSIGGTPEKVILAPGSGIITDPGAGGSFPFVIPNQVEINLPTRPATGQSRISDLIGVIKNDEVRPADAAREFDVQLSNGAPSAGAPPEPTVPTGAFRFRRLTIPAAGDVSLSMSPPRIAALGGIIPVANLAERNAISPKWGGLEVYREDLAATEVCVDPINNVWRRITNEQTFDNDDIFAGTPGARAVIAGRMVSIYLAIAGVTVAAGEQNTYIGAINPALVPASGYMPMNGSPDAISCLVTPGTGALTVRWIGKAITNTTIFLTGVWPLY